LEGIPALDDQRIKKIVIVGGGTAGWMAAAGISRVLTDRSIHIQLIESEAIGTVGVGEATIPHMLYFNNLLGFKEDDFVRKTNATFKLGIEFVNWGRIGDRYVHPFGEYGQAMEGIHFHHFWLRHQRSGDTASIDDYNLPIAAALSGKFQRPDFTRPNTPLASINYAFQFDAALYAKYMREFAEAQGVKRTEGKIMQVNKRAADGFVESVTLENGDICEGDFFIDCSGFRGLLIEQALETGYEDWSAFLPCNRAVARACEKVEEPIPYTRATAREAGWQWRIPLQSRTGNGHVYCSDYISDDEALETLNANLDGAPISEPNFLRFTTGIRKKTWNKNVVAIGLAAGFMEPLESTSIHLIQTAIARLMTNFPDKNFNQHDIDYFNERTLLEYQQVRDFLVLHYYATERDDTPFWNYCRNMEIPDTLKQRLSIYHENARLYRHDNELFGETSWLAVLHGQNISPQRYHPVADCLSDEELDKRMFSMRRAVANCLNQMPTHKEFIDRHCKAEL
jgi:tryptophan 7-halogenase